MREITEDMILDAIEDGWKREDAEKGYAIIIFKYK